MPRPSARDRALAVVSAVVLSAATLWTVLVEARVTVDPPPDWVPGTDYGAFLETWYAWQAGTLGQERAALALLCLGLAGVAVSGVRVGLRGSTARVSAALAVAAGAAAWAFVSITQAGGRHAVEQMAASGNQIDAVNSIAFTIDTTAGWNHAAASALLASGLLVLVAARASLLWRTTCVAAGAVGWVFALLLLAESEWAKYAGLVLGAVLLPLWVAATWLGQDSGDGPAGTTGAVDVRRTGQAPTETPAAAAAGQARVSMMPMFPFRSFR